MGHYFLDRRYMRRLRQSSWYLHQMDLGVYSQYSIKHELTCQTGDTTFTNIVAQSIYSLCAIRLRKNNNTYGFQCQILGSNSGIFGRGTGARGLPHYPVHASAAGHMMNNWCKVNTKSSHPYLNTKRFAVKRVTHGRVRKRRKILLCVQESSYPILYSNLLYKMG